MREYRVSPMARRRKVSRISRIGRRMKRSVRAEKLTPPFDVMCAAAAFYFVSTVIPDFWHSLPKEAESFSKEKYRAQKHTLAFKKALNDAGVLWYD